MASSKGSNNSNKTAHVMNLLRKNTAPAAAQSSEAVPPEQAAQPEQQAQQAPAAAAAPVTPQIPPIITALNADAEISAQIRDALNDIVIEEEVRNTDTASAASDSNRSFAEDVLPPDEMPGAALPPDSAPESAAAVGTAEEDAPRPAFPSFDQDAPGDSPLEETISSSLSQEAALEEASAFEPDSTAAPADDAVEVSAAHNTTSPQTVTEEDTAPSEDAAASSIAAPQKDVRAEADTKIFNIMEHLTEEKADKYIQMFGLCPCRRCRQDVIANTLNNLRPIYVVMQPSEMKIYSDMYEKRYNGEITSQLLRACAEITAHPNHAIPSDEIT